MRFAPGQTLPTDQESSPKLIGIKVEKAPKDRPPDQLGSVLAAELDRAADLKSKGKWEQALEVLDGIITRPNADPAIAALAQCRKGEYLLWMGQPGRALDELKKVEARHASQTETMQWARVAMIDAYNFLGQGRQAEDAARSVITAHGSGAATDKQCAWARVKLGGLLRQRGALDEALNVLRGVDALTLPSDDLVPKIHAGVALADILRARGQQYEAVPVLEGVIAASKAADPHMANWARVHLMEILVHKFQPTRAVKLFDEVMADHAAGRADDRQLGWALVWKGRTLTQSRNVEEAASSLRMTVALLQTDGPDAPYRFPEIAYAAMVALGELTEEQAYCERVKSAARSLHQQALEHYLAAFELAPKEAVVNLDKVRQRIGHQMVALGQRERAVAWWRMGIEDPANTSDEDLQLANRIADNLSADQAEAWRQFLIDPAAKPDPTEHLVKTELAAVSPKPTSATVNRPFDRRYWLGRLYQQQRRFAKAVEAFSQAERVAGSDRDRAAALSGVASCHRRRGDTAAARQAADQAARRWLLAIENASSDADAHHAIDMAVLNYNGAGFPDEALAVLQRVINRDFVERHPARACFARFRLVQEYMSRRRFDEAKKLAEETLERFLNAPFDQGHDTICGYLLIHLASIHTRHADFDKAESNLAEAERRWPYQLRDQIESQRRLLETRKSEALGQKQ